MLIACLALVFAGFTLNKLAVYGNGGAMPVPAIRRGGRWLWLADRFSIAWTRGQRLYYSAGDVLFSGGAVGLPLSLFL